MKSILDLNHIDAREFFLDAKSYCSLDLPPYFNFQKLISEISTKIAEKPIEDLYLNPPDYSKESPKAGRPYPSEFDDVNYKLLDNKDGKFAWRPYQLIHPVLYVSLVHNMTNEINWGLIVSKFKEFGADSRITCHSIPPQALGKQTNRATTVTKWWTEIEQQSLILSLKYDYVLHTDISDCYGSIYTHTIPWAIHTKDSAKVNRAKYGNIGNIIDHHLKSMAYGQTNGIPQGSVLMDFIAEIVLGYADTELTKRISGTISEDYHIIRYRDDYRIFSNNPHVAELITKSLTEVLIGLGMRLNIQKTLTSGNVVRDSIKPDKNYWMWVNYRNLDIQKYLLLIHALSEKFPNSGSLKKALTQFYRKIEKLDTLNYIDVLISILVNIMYRNPGTYPIASAILSKLLSLLENQIKIETILQTVKEKFKNIPNTGYLEVWLQRLTIKIDRTKIYDEWLCKKIYNPAIQIWNSKWLNEDFEALIESISVIDEESIETIDTVIKSSEVRLFKPEYSQASYD